MNDSKNVPVFLGSLSCKPSATVVKGGIPLTASFFQTSNFVIEISSKCHKIIVIDNTNKLDRVKEIATNYSI